MDKPIFELITLNEAEEFILNMPEKAQDKMLYNIRKIRYGVKDKDLFKKLGDSGIWEFRASLNGMTYRLFSFWDKDNKTLVVATHGLVKKSQKTPQKDIDKAKAIRKEWFDSKK